MASSRAWRSADMGALVEEMGVCTNVITPRCPCNPVPLWGRFPNLPEAQAGWETCPTSKLNHPILPRRTLRHPHRVDHQPRLLRCNHVRLLARHHALQKVVEFLLEIATPLRMYLRPVRRLRIAQTVFGEQRVMAAGVVDVDGSFR